jgi:predicted phosphoribosyltransferase
MTDRATNLLPFKDRREAGQKLATALSSWRNEACLVLALPRGGVPVAAEVASALNAPLDLVLVRKIGAPDQPELAIGAIVDGATPMILHNDEIIRVTHTTEAEFRAICARERVEIERRRKMYFGDRLPIDPKDRVVIVVDDGIATGASVRVALQAIRGHAPRRLILAVPVAPKEAVESLRSEADEIVCLATPEPFGAVGYFYRDFSQTSDDEVIALLRAHPAQQTAV